MSSLFQLRLSYESWDNIFEGNDVNIIFNNFLTPIFYSIFIKKNITFRQKYNLQITTGIRISCNKKRELHY
jgi:hypothetical protein